MAVKRALEQAEMKSIAVATDFSSRSDRAIRRAVLLAREFAAPLTLVHAVDDDQPEHFARAKAIAAQTLLNEQGASITAVDGVNCTCNVALGDAFLAITTAAADADLLVLGPHRRQALKDVFVGTTAERTIREANRPVLMANGVPAGPYRDILVAVDFSNCSLEALQAVEALELNRIASVSLLHTTDVPEVGMRSRAWMSEEQIQDVTNQPIDRAKTDMAEFLGRCSVHTMRQIIRPLKMSTAATILAVAKEIDADLVVVGTHGRTGIDRLMLGSVAEEVLQTAEVDVLAVPPKRIS